MAAAVGFILYLLSGQGTFVPVALFEDEAACTTAVEAMETALGKRPRDSRFACLEMQSLVDLLQKNGIQN